MKGAKRYTVTAALPYANGPIHIGHLAGAYLPADIYVRWLRANGKDVIFICGTDEHGVPITIKAKNEKVSPQEIVDRYYQIISSSFEKFGISFDIFSQTSKEIHHRTAADFFTTLNNKGVFTETETEQYFDEQENQFLADRYIIGTCPKCSNDKAYGDQCEKCGTSLSPDELINPVSALSGKTPILKKTKNWFLPLDKIQTEFLNNFINSKKDWKTNVSGQCKSWLNEGLKPRAMTRDLDWGVKVPLKEAENKVLYVWFDAPIGYISATKELLPENWEKYWKDPETSLIHFIGKDNIVFHCVIFPAMLHSHGGYILPKQVPANEFLNLEGEKISTSRNHAIWLHEYLDDFPSKQDELRYVLTSIAPETKDADFTWKDFQARVNNELCSIIGNFVNRVLVLSHKYFDGFVQPCSFTEATDKNIITEIKKIQIEISNLISEFKFREAQAELVNMIRLGNKYITDSEPWHLIKTDEKRVGEILHICIVLTHNFAVSALPFLPFTADKIFDLLNTNKEQTIKNGTKLNNPILLFEKIDDEKIEKQIEKIKIKSNVKIFDNPHIQKSSIAEIKPNINFDDFVKTDMRIATIIEAERVENTEKLLKLTLDTGIDKRTVVSGIANHFNPQEIIGVQVCLLANLEPRKIKGIESNGMILMTENADGQLVFVSPSVKAMNGATIR
ncbi:MAG: methionine--tRNA ligase [Bacteroidetes bacterium]|nr:methionine--tRNA ligase [Bacteroidota bacterium]